MKAIPETRRVHLIRYLRFYYEIADVLIEHLQHYFNYFKRQP